MNHPAQRAAALAIVVTVGIVGVVAQQPATPTFGNRVDAVRVDVLVTENGAPVTGLTANDFEVTDNGVPQQVELLAFDQLPLNVIMAFDVSESTIGERLLQLKIGARAVLTALARGDRAALLTFSESIKLRRALTTDLEAVRTAINSLTPAGRTLLVDGTYSALTLSGSDAGRDLVLVFSDGLDTDSILTPDRVLEAARRTGAVLYGITAGSSGRVGFIKDLTDQTGGQSLEIPSAVDLQKVFAGVVDEFRRRYVLSFTPRGVAATGWHRLQVRVKGRRPTIVARQGYTAG